MKRNIVGKRLLSERILNKVVYPPRVEPEIIPHVTQRNLEKFIRGETFQSQVASDSDTGGDPSIYLLLPGEDIVEEHRPHPHETHEEDEDEGVDASCVRPQASFTSRRSMIAFQIFAMA